MIKQRKPRARRDAFQNRRNQIIHVAERKGNFGDNDARAGAFRHKVECIAAGVVFMVGSEQFIARLKCERAQNSIYSARRVWHEDEIAGLRSGKLREVFTRGIEMRFEFAHEELQRLPFHSRAPFALKFQNAARAGAKRAVTQKNNFRVEQPVLRISCRSVQ